MLYPYYLRYSKNIAKIPDIKYVKVNNRVIYKRYYSINKKYNLVSPSPYSYS
jgi:hypothetical protein